MKCQRRTGIRCGGEVDESAYYSHSIEEFDGNSTEWEEYGGEVYGREG